jgi:transcriptional regulator with XRE-family HTH domain
MASDKIHPATEALAYNIRVLRAKRNNMSQIVLAVEANTTPATISAIENSEGNPTLEILQRLADALGVEVAVLFAKPE